MHCIFLFLFLLIFKNFLYLCKQTDNFNIIYNSVDNKVTYRLLAHVQCLM